jgi:hypothetical protein
MPALQTANSPSAGKRIQKPRAGKIGISRSASKPRPSSIIFQFESARHVLAHKRAVKFDRIDLFADAIVEAEPRRGHLDLAMQLNVLLGDGGGVHIRNAVIEQVGVLGEMFDNGVASRSGKAVVRAL